MGSILPGFECDIFISYRQNDNSPSRGYGEQGRSGWVTDFVKALESELGATIKEPVSIYFDSNPDDGLLESHNVDKSLEGKLKCLIFIPILSQTYCDPKGFAWQHEFVAFNEAAVNSVLGRDIKLTSGNVACRILPVRIHDLDPEDKAAIEREMGSILRSIDFTYKEPGVNRPLTPEDSADVNLNKTRYKNQVNKVANAIKDLLHSLEHVGDSQPSPTHHHTSSAAQGTRKFSRMVLAALALVVSVSIGYWVFNRTSGSMSTAEGLEKSIAVLPFSNLSNDPEQEYFSDGITDQIITNLSHLRDVKVIARTSVLKYKGTTSSISDIGTDLSVNYVLEGSVQRSGNKLRINAQLIRANDNFHEWAEIFDRDFTDIFAVQDDISQSIATALGNTLNSEDLINDRPSNTAAYDAYLQAKHIAFTQYYFNRRDNINEAFNNAKTLYEKAIKLDTTFALAYAGLADLYDELRNHGVDAFPKELDSLRRSLARKAFALDPNSGFVNNVKAYVLFQNTDKRNWDSVHYYMKRAFVLDPGDSYLGWCLGSLYCELGLQEEGLAYLRKAKSESPNDPKAYAKLASALYELGELDEARENFEKVERLASGTAVYGKWTVLWWLFMEGQTERADKFMKNNPEMNNPFWNSFLDAARGDKEKVLSRETILHPHYLLLGMNVEALQALEKENPDNWNPYLYLKHCRVWEPLRTMPEYTRLLEKARVANENARKRFGYQ